MYYLVSHVVYQNSVPIYGPIHVVADFLSLKKHKFIQITAPLTFEGFYEYKNSKVVEKLAINFTAIINKYLHDFKFIFRSLLKRFPQEEDTVVVADPLCALPFVLIKIFMPFNFIYYTVDYSDKRFDNILIDIIYRFLDFVSLLACDTNWCVSSRIVDKRKKNFFGNKAVFVPNTPIVRTNPLKQKTQNKNKCIYVGRMEKNMFIPILLETFKKFSKSNSTLHLTLIGGGTLSSEVAKFIDTNKLKKTITYLGPLDNKKVQEQLASHGIGLAFYGDSKNWNRYGDSMKVREYQQFGLPVITTDIPSNAEEITSCDAGIVLKFNSVTSSTIQKSITEIQSKFLTYSTNATKLARNNSKIRILENLLKV